MAEFEGGHMIINLLLIILAGKFGQVKFVIRTQIS